MGILTNLIELSHRQAAERRQEQMDLYSNILRLAGQPNVDPNAQEKLTGFALEGMTGLADKKAAGPLREVGQMFKGLIGKQQNQARQGFQQVLSELGKRPGTTLNIPGGSQVPGQTIGGGEAAIGGQAPPQFKTPGVNMSQMLPPRQEQLAPMSPKLLLSPEEQIEQEKKRTIAANDLQFDLQQKISKAQEDIRVNSELNLEKRRFDAQQTRIKELMAPGPDGKPSPFNLSDAIGLATGHYPPSEKTRSFMRVPGTEPRLTQLGADPKKFYSVVEDETGKVLYFNEAAAPAGASEQLTGTVKTAIQSLRLAHPDWSDDRIKQQAGKIVSANLGATVDKKLLDAEIDRQLATEFGIRAPGATFGPGGAPAARPAGGAAAPTRPAAPIGGSTPPGSTAPAPGSDENLINQYISQVLNPVPGTRGTKFSQLAMAKGRRVLMEKTGLTPYSLDAALTTKKGTAQALQNAIQMQGGFERLQNTLTSFGDLLVNARSKVNDSGVSVLNRWVQAGLRTVPGDPDVAKLDIAANAVARIYSQVLAGGYQSKAMPPVQSADDAKQQIASWMQDGRITGAVDQMKLEAQTETEAMRTQQQSLYDELSKPITETRPGGVTPPGLTPGPTPGLPKPPQPGASASDAIIKQYLDAAGGKVEEARKNLTGAGWVIPKK